MTPERWLQIKHLFETALAQEPEGRPSFLEAACAGDIELRRQVEAMLNADAGTDELLDRPAYAAIPDLLSLPETQFLLRIEPPAESLIGRSIGVYQPTRSLGRGGMGEVYLAYDARLDRHVALKLLPARYAEDDERVRRFQREARAASALNHPNILTIFDIGHEAGRHYIATEYVEGQTLRALVDGAEMSLGQAIDVASQIASALDAAHTAGIIHRDIKPENVMLRPDGYVKVLDFGLAKLTDPNSSPGGNGANEIPAFETRAGVILGTVAYMSPEQARGQKLDHRTDIFSLGVILYEMITGRRPFEGATINHTLVAILDQEAPPLTRHWPDAPGALQTLVGRTLSKDRDARPASARELLVQLKSLKDDLALESKLDLGKAVAGFRSPTGAVDKAAATAPAVGRKTTGALALLSEWAGELRQGKFTQRHRWGLAASALIALLVIGGAVLSNYQARRAERRFQQVRKLTGSFLFDFDSKIQNVAGATEARELLVKTALEYLDSLAQEAGGEAELQYELATAYSRVGDVQGNPDMSNLGRSTDALASYRKALTLVEPLAARAPQNPQYQRMLAGLHFRIGQTQQQFGAFADALAAHRRGVAIIEPVAARTDVTAEDLAQLMTGYRLMGDLEVEYLPAVAAGVRHYQQAMDVAQRRVRAFPGDRAQFDLAGRHIQLSYALLQLGDPQTAKMESEAGLALLEPLAAQHPNESLYQRAKHIGYQHLGMAQGQPLGVNLNDPAAALQSFAKMQAIARRLVAADAKDHRASDDLAVGLILIGETEAVTEPARGAATLRQAMDELRALAAGGGDPFRYRLLQTETLTYLAAAENRLGAGAGAQSSLREAQAVWQTLAAEQPNDFSVKLRDYELQQVLAEARWAQGDFDGAQTALRRAQSFAEADRGAKPAEAIPLWRLADCYQRFGACYESQAGRARQPEERRAAYKQARDWYQKCLHQWDDWPSLAVSGVFNTTRRDLVTRALARCESQLKP